MTNSLPVYRSNTKKAERLGIILIVLLLPIGLFLYGWFFQDAAGTLWLTGFGVFVVGLTLLVAWKSKLLSLSSAPVFIFCTRGIEVPPDKLLPWTAFKDALVFTYERNKSIGFWFFYGVAYHVHTVKVRDVLKLLRNDGWVLVTTAGSHRQFKHPTKSGRVTVAGHPSDDLHPKTLKSILTQAGMKK